MTIYGCAAIKLLCDIFFVMEFLEVRVVDGISSSAQQVSWFGGISHRKSF